MLTAALLIALQPGCTVLPDNRPMLRLAKKLGFSSRYSEEDEAMVVALPLNEPADDWQRERLGQV